MRGCGSSASRFHILGTNDRRIEAKNIISLEYPPFKCGKNRFKDCSTFFGYFMVPKTQDGISSTIQPHGSCFVRQVSSMMKPIDFDNQPFFPTQKIDDVGPEWDLSRKFISIQPPVSQIPPEPIFFLGFVPPQPARLAGFAGPPFRDVRFILL